MAAKVYVLLKLTNTFANITPNAVEKLSFFRQFKLTQMAKYYVNKNPQSNGDHEVHKESCTRMPDSQNRIYLGEFFSCSGAVQKAKQYYVKADGCYYCSNACHKS